MPAPRTPSELAEHDRSLRAAIDSLDAEDDDPPSSARLTPESGDEHDEYDDDAAFLGRGDGRGDSGYEMDRLDGDGAAGARAGWRDMADEHERGLEEAEEREGKRPAYTRDEERGVVRKLDRRLVLFMALLYMLSFLDRSSMSSLGEMGPHERHGSATDGAYRHWQRAHRRHGGGSWPLVQPVSVAPHGFLHHLHPVRVDDAHVPHRRAAHLHLHLRPVLGHPRVSTVSDYLFRGPAHNPGIAGRRRGGVWTRLAFLPELLLSSRRAGAANGALYQRSTTFELLCGQSGVADYLAWGQRTGCAMEAAVPSRRFSERPCRHLRVVLRT